MFAVKGWSVDSSALKAQVAPLEGSQGTSKEAARKDRKRKRGIGGSSHAQPKEDVGKLWEQHIEGKDPGRAKGILRKDKKRRKLQDASAGKVEQGLLPDRLDKTKGKRDTLQTVTAVSDVTAEKPVKKKKKEKRRPSDEARQRSTDVAAGPQKVLDVARTAPPPVPSLPATAKLTPMQTAMRHKLVSARFRHLNQTLYTAPSAAALHLFDQNPEMFEDYHAGFRQQVDVWPENPLDNFIATITTRGKVKPASFKDKKARNASETNSDGSGTMPALPRTHGTCIIADMGCGDARLAQTLQDNGHTTKLNLKLHSYDLHSPFRLVTKADISNLPLADGFADVTIFCLALMGTNWISFIEEAYRVLHWKGELWVAEIKSRFGRASKAGKPVEHSVGGRKKQAAMQKATATKQREDEEVDEQAVLRTAVDGVETMQQETDVSAFVDVLRRRGFLLKDGEKSVDLSKKMFVKMEFVKAATPTKGKGVVKAEQKGFAKSGQGKKKFVEKPAEEVLTDDEAKVLKPCLYKIR